jgi:hypothetical protein
MGAKRNGGAERVTCRVELVLEPAGSVRTRGRTLTARSTARRNVSAI